jgi:hypothetical protein
MKSSRFVFITALLALLLLIVPAAFAQDFGLSDADSNLLAAANENSAGASSFAYDFVATLSIIGLDAQPITANLSGSGVIVSDMSGDLFSLQVLGQLGSGGQTIPVNFEARLINDMLYFNLGDGSGWMGGPLDELLGDDMFGELTGGMGTDLPVDPGALASGDLSDLMMMPGLTEAMTGLSTLEPERYISLNRLATEGGVAQFRLTLDLAGLLSSPEIGSLLGMAMMGDAGSTGMSQAEMAQMGQMIGMMFAGSSISLDQYVDVERELVNRTVLAVTLPLEGLLGAPGAGIDLTFDINLSGYGQSFKVEAPASFTPLN